MASWRAPGSILEALDSIFEAPSLDLGGFWNDFFEFFSQNAKKAKNAKDACQNKNSMTNPTRVGGRRCSPPGGFQWNRAQETSWPPLGPSWAALGAISSSNIKQRKSRFLPPRGVQKRTQMAPQSLLGASWRLLGRKNRVPRGLQKLIKF